MRIVKIMEIPLDLKYKVNKKYQGKSFNLKNKEYYINEIVNSYITYILACYRTIYKNYKDENLWQIFYKDFEGFIFNIFKLSHYVAVKEL